MTGKLSFFILCLAALAPLPANAADWHAVTGGRGMSIEVDESSMDRTEKTVKAWTRVSYSDARQASPGDFFFASYKSLAQYDCAARTVKPLFKVYYAEDGSEVTSVRYTEFDKAAQVVPDTAEEQILQFACRHKPEAAKATDKKKKKPAKKRKPKAKADKAEATKAEAKPAAQPPPAAPAAKPPQPAEPAKGGAVKPSAPAKPAAAAK